MSKVYFIKVDTSDLQAVSRAGRKLLETLVAEEKVVLADKLPIKTHFGEKGNRTYIKPECYDGIIDYLQECGKDDRIVHCSISEKFLVQLLYLLFCLTDCNNDRRVLYASGKRCTCCVR